MEENVKSNESALLEKIALDAQNKCDRIILDAQNYYDQAVKRANEDAKAYIDGEEARAVEAGEEYIRRSSTMDALEERKTVLSAKRRLIDGVYEGALSMLKNMDKDKYLSFVETLLAKYAKKGERVVLSKTAPFDEIAVLSLPTAKKLQLTAEKSGEFDGGIILTDGKVDKNLTFESLCNSIKEQTEFEVSAHLFE